tara:strand:- start:2472 stop:2642 length:171 start_codon:yes stop_codon:yes gene_type:complete
MGMFDQMFREKKKPSVKRKAATDPSMPAEGMAKSVGEAKVRGVGKATKGVRPCKMR